MGPDEVRLPAGHTASATGSTRGLGEKIARVLLTHPPAGPLVHWVARLRVSVHAKLLCAFLLVALLLVGMGAMSLQTIATMSRQIQLLDRAHARVDSSRRIEHALAMQRSEEHTSELQSQSNLVCRLLLE